MAPKTSSRPFSTQPTQNQHLRVFFYRQHQATTINTRFPSDGDLCLSPLFLRLRVKAPSFDILQVPEATGEEQGIHTSPICHPPNCHPITVGS